MYSYSQVYSQIRENIQSTDAVADLKWWAVNRGPEMSMSWPTYEVSAGDFVLICDQPYCVWSF